MKGLSILLLALSLVAKDASALRGVIPGTPCDSLIGLEARLGSSLRGSLPTDLSGELITLFFDGSSHGRSALISYRCESGRVSSQQIVFGASSEKEGHTLFSDWHRRLSDEFGPPFKDLDEPTLNAMHDMRTDPTRRFASWGKSSQVINLALWLAENGTWEVVVHGP